MTILQSLEKESKKADFRFDEIVFKNHIENRIRQISTVKNSDEVLEQGSMNKFCKNFGFNRPNLQNWLNGKKDLKLSTFFRLCRVLQLEIKIGDVYAIYDLSKRNAFGNESTEPKHFDFAFILD